VLVTPTTRADEAFRDFPQGVKVWSFADPNEVPALYDPANRHDPTHLNHAGAKAFTDLLAERFAATMKPQP